MDFCWVLLMKRKEIPKTQVIYFQDVVKICSKLQIKSCHNLDQCGEPYNPLIAVARLQAKL